MDLNRPRLEFGALSETGYVREENQDRMSGSVAPAGHLYIVADGMGGHMGGALAAELTVDVLRKHIGEAPADTPVEKLLRDAFASANNVVYEKGHSGDSETEGMGSAAVLLLALGKTARVAHVGDSRAYLFRNSRLSRLTTDHTRVQRMVDAGMLRPEEAEDHPDSSVLERAIGNRPEVAVDISGELPLIEGDAFLLCSDGLSAYVSDKEIESVLKGDAVVQEVPARLVGLALGKGGRDNITVQFIQYGKRIRTRTEKWWEKWGHSLVRAERTTGPTIRTIYFLILAAGAFFVFVFIGYRLLSEKYPAKAVIKQSTQDKTRNDNKKRKDKSGVENITAPNIDFKP